MTQEENPLADLLGGLQNVLEGNATAGAAGSAGAAGAAGSAGRDPVGQIMGMLGAAPGAGTAQATGPSISPNVISSVLGVLGGGAATGTAGATGTTGAAGATGLLGAVTGATGGQAAGLNGLGGLVDQLKAGGLASEVESWIGSGANKPVSPEALGQALGPQGVQQLSSSTGLSPAQLLPQLAAFLPLLINHLTPNGAASLTGGSGSDLLGGLGSLLGGLANR